MNPQPGEIWLADLGLAAKTRPVVIVSRRDPDPPRALVLYVPLTTKRRDSPYEVPLPRLPFLDRESVVNVQGLGSLPTVRLERKIAGFPPRHWSGSRTRWPLRWILNGLPDERSAAPAIHGPLPVGRTVAYTWPEGDCGAPRLVTFDKSPVRTSKRLCGPAGRLGADNGYS